MLFNHLNYNEVVWIGTQVSIFLEAVFDMSLGIQEGLLDLRFLHKLPGKENRTTSVDLPEATTSSPYKKFMDFFTLFRYKPRASSSWYVYTKQCERRWFSLMHS